MIAQIENLFAGLEQKKRRLLGDLAAYSENRLHRQPAPDRWSMAMVVQHIIIGEKGLRQSEEALRDNPVRRLLQPGKLFGVVMDILENDVPVDVPDPGLEPDNNTSFMELIRLWGRERKQLLALLETISEDETDEIMFSHPAAGPLDPIRALRLAHAHFDTHRRQIDKLSAELQAS